MGNSISTQLNAAANSVRVKQLAGKAALAELSVCCVAEAVLVAATIIGEPLPPVVLTAPVDVCCGLRPFMI